MTPDPHKAWEARRTILTYVHDYDLQSVPLTKLLDYFTSRPGGIYDLPMVSTALLHLLKTDMLVLTPARYINLGWAGKKELGLR